MPNSFFASQTYFSSLACCLFSFKKIILFWICFSISASFKSKFSCSYFSFSNNYAVR